ncbi:MULTISPECIES: AraC family transcriptional regulator [Marinobacter]|uniref:AraC family transcriptional regulator n=1 Tax=Marinobacter xestospongiae TaxID=994319 RepID=A0ABU3VSY4_9GAMM|nr:MULTISPECIES: AraC family transcriptional regulator [Marinobacter]MCG8518301.1 AraC family transcriptional regulator [Pseudomonadales bacterium]MCK7567731.1 AraC family transcriptional regulator [Marinobacter xestospongiae]MDV2077384.1 AraC family transcriptional regulator [Marinobacter xestospongiae]UDL04218.1 AraC family transcriptional regulator [Marinobacter sp. CA1]
MKNLTFSSHYARAIVYGLEKNGYNVQNLLTDRDIDLALIREPKARVPTKQFIRLFRLTWKELDDEFMGRTSRPCRVGHFHLMGSLVVHSTNLEEVLRQSIRCYRLFNEDIEITLNLEGDEVELSLAHHHPELDPDNFLVEWLLLVWHRLVGWLIGRKIVLSQATFTHELPPHFDEYRFVFPCRCDFGRERNSLFFSKQYLTMPVARTSKELDDFVLSSPRDLLIWTDEDDSITTQVRQALELCDEEKLPNQDWIASQLHMTAYTLSRKLKAEGSSYQKIKDNLRRDQAVTMLTRQNLSVADISSRLGFAEPGAFSRAFKHWTGVSPLAYRKQDQ